VCSDSFTGTNVSGYLHKSRYCVIKETLVGLTEVALSAKIIFVERSPIFHTSTATNSKMPTDKALVAQILLGPGKGPLSAAAGQFFYRRLKNVAQPPLRLNKKIAAESITSMLDNDVLAALLVECADRVPASNVI